MDATTDRRGPTREGERSRLAGRRVISGSLLVAVVLLVLTLSSAPASFVPGHGVEAGAVSRAVPLPGGLTWMVAGDGAIPAGALPLDPVAASTPLTFEYELNLLDPVAVQSYLTGIYTPGSPTYHHYVSGRSFEAMFGPSATSVEALNAYLQTFGLTTQEHDTGGLGVIYEVQGTVGQVNAALHVTIYWYRDAGRTAMAPLAPPALPTSLAPVVEDFQNLNGLDVARPTLEMGPSAPAAVISPSAMEGAYGESSLLTVGVNGSKFVVGLAEECDPTQLSSTYQTDVNAFIASYDPGTKDTIALTDDTGSCSSGSPGWGGETDLDIQWSHVMAPGTSQDVCLDDLDAITCDSNFVNDGILFGSNSFLGGGPYDSVWDAAAAAGTTLLASAGDGCAGVGYPAEQTWGIGVGGTSLTVSGTSWSSESAWSCSGGSGTGGGCGTDLGPPLGQVNMTGFPGVCGSTTVRGVPDVAADADPSTGVEIVSNGTAYTNVGGTSLSCPMWAAMLDVLYQQAGATGGFALPTIYGIAESSAYGTDFHDITSGSNGYPATVGWDPDTGVGTPILAALASSWPTSTLTASITPSSTTVEAGSTVPLTVTLHGGTGPFTYTWEQNGTAIPGAPNSASFAYVQDHAATGPYSISVTVDEATGGPATTGPSLITVSPGPSVQLTANRTQVDGGQSIGLTASASGGSGTYPSYVWSFNGTVLATTGTPTYDWTAPGASTSGFLGVRVVDSSGGSAFASVAVEVFGLPTVHLALDPSGPVDIGSTVDLIAQAAGGSPPLQYAFLLNGTTVLQSGAASSFAWTPSRGGTDALSATVTDSLAGTATSATILLTVDPDPEVALRAPSPAVVDVGVVSTLSATASGGTAPFAFAWTVDGQAVPGHGPLLNLSETAPGTYTVATTVTDAVGKTAASTEVSLAVHPLPSVSLAGAGSVVASSTDELTASVTGGTGPFSYTWQIDGRAVASATGASLGFSEGSTGTYTVTVDATDSVGSSTVATKVVNVTAAALPWYDQPFIPGTTAGESWGILGVIVVGALVAVIFLLRKRTKSGPRGSNWNEVVCRSCGARSPEGSWTCSRCGRSVGPSSSGSWTGQNPPG